MPEDCDDFVENDCFLSVRLSAVIKEKAAKCGFYEFR